MSKTSTTIDDYFSSVKSKLLDYETLIVLFNLSFEKRTKTAGLILGSIEFIDQSVLHVLEYVYSERELLKHSSYRFHWQDLNEELII